jgi:Heterokaryon incompatibility protein (HET)
MTSIQYSDLDPQKHEIRLFTLLPREDHSSTTLSENLIGDDGNAPSKGNLIRGTLKTHVLEDELSYVALSYTWGKEEPSATIQVDGQLVTVRENLEAALRYLQQSDRPTILWIDAICINQRNEAEKSHQVQMMCEIYKKAFGALVWLGLPKDGSDAAMEKFANIGKKAIEAGIQEFRAADMPKWFEPGGDERVLKIKGPLNELAAKEGLGVFHPAMVPFSKRDYWTRVWVLQEICVVRDVMMQCGRTRLLFTTFAAASNFCAFARWSLGTRFTSEDWKDPVMGPKLKAVSGSENAPSSAPNVLIGARRRYHEETGEQESLRSLLQRTCVLRQGSIPLKATDARDKIYGLLGLLSDSSKLRILSDYTKSVQDVYTDVARALIADGQTTILAWSQRPKYVEGLPSWVPDFSAPIREPCGEDHQAGALFSASGNRTVSILRSTDTVTLGLLGTRIGTIKELGTAWEPSINGPVDREAVQLLLNEVEAFCDRSSFFATQEQASDAKMRIPCADQAARGLTRWRASNSILEEYKLWGSPTISTSSYFPSPQYQSTMGFQHNRKPFLSAEGYVGLAPAFAIANDLIVIIFGCTVPFVLREFDGGKPELIGEAYVHGIMDGEFLKEDRAAEAFHFC